MNETIMQTNGEITAGEPPATTPNVEDNSNVEENSFDVANGVELGADIEKLINDEGEDGDNPAPKEEPQGEVIEKQPQVEEANVAPEKTFNQAQVDEIFRRRIGEVNSKHEHQMAELTSEIERQLDFADKLTNMWEGDTLEERYINMKAVQEDTTPQEIRQQQEAAKSEFDKLVENHPDVVEARRIKEERKQEYQKQMFDNDYRTLSEEFGSLQFDSMEKLLQSEIGDDYAKMRGAGIQPVEAYKFILTRRAENEKPLPVAPSRIGNASIAGGDNDGRSIDDYTPEEIAKDPKLYDKMMKDFYKT